MDGCCARAAAGVEGDAAGGVGGFRGAVGGERGVGLRGLAGEDVEGGVDGDFEVAAFGRVVDVGFGEAHDDLCFGQYLHVLWLGSGSDAIP